MKFGNSVAHIHNQAHAIWLGCICSWQFYCTLSRGTVFLWTQCRLLYGVNVDATQTAVMKSMQSCLNESSSCCLMNCFQRSQNCPPTCTQDFCTCTQDLRLVHTPQQDSACKSETGLSWITTRSTQRAQTSAEHGNLEHPDFGLWTDGSEAWPGSPPKLYHLVLEPCPTHTKNFVKIRSQVCE